MKKHKDKYIFLFLLIIACSRTNDYMRYSNIGDNYSLGSFYGRYLRVTFLRDDFKLEKRSDNAPDDINVMYEIPYESNVRAYIIKDNQIVQKIDSLSSFENYADIDSKEKAIEFVRFRTSEDTFFLFQPENMIEVFFDEESDEYEIGKCSQGFKEKYGIKNIEVIEGNGYYEVRRFLLYVPWPKSDNFNKPPSLYSVVEKVFKNGQYLIKMDYISNEVKFDDVILPPLPR